MSDFFEKFIEFCETSACYGESNSNGADAYCCPSCYSRLLIKGYALGSTNIEYLDHREDCILYNLYLEAKDNS